MKNFIRKFKKKYKEFYAFKYLVFTGLFALVGLVLMILTEVNEIFAYVLILEFIMWYILVGRHNSKIQIIRAKIVKELEVEKLVNDRYIKENIK